MFFSRLAAYLSTVMAVLVTAIHVFLASERRTWMPGTSPGMTTSFNVHTAHEAHASTVLPLLITATLRDFTLASNEITLPSFHRSMVTVSPG
jgi:hypothetical protein